MTRLGNNLINENEPKNEQPPLVRASRDILKDVDEFGEVNIFCRININKRKVQENKSGWENAPIASPVPGTRHSCLDPKNFLDPKFLVLFLSIKNLF